MGTRWKVDEQDNTDVARILLNRKWPTQARQHVRGNDGTGPGHGTCLGATYERGVARLGRLTNDMTDIVVRLNILLEKYVSNFQWTSIQVNINTVSRKHTDSNNDGPSVMFVLGDFTGGNFGTAAGKQFTIGCGEAMIFNGKQHHWSEVFQGTRVSIVYFAHSTYSMLSVSDRDRLLKLGFGRGMSCDADKEATSTHYHEQGFR